MATKVHAESATSPLGIRRAGASRAHFQSAGVVSCAGNDVSALASESASQTARTRNVMGTPDV
jgi:hypothetical protein